ADAYEIDPGFATSLSLYGRLLGRVYYFLGSSHLLGNALSVLATSLACVLLVKILREIGVARRVGSLAIFGLMPSAIMLLSVTLREAYQQLFFLLALHATLQMRRAGWRWVPVLLGAAAVLAVLHDGLTLYAGFLVI